MNSVNQFLGLCVYSDFLVNLRSVQLEMWLIGNFELTPINNIELEKLFFGHVFVTYKFRKNDRMNLTAREKNHMFR